MYKVFNVIWNQQGHNWGFLWENDPEHKSKHKSWAQSKLESRNLFRAQTCNDLLLMPMISVSKPLTTIVTVLYMENQKQNERKYENNP